MLSVPVAVLHPTAVLFRQLDATSARGVILLWLHRLVLTGFLVCKAHFILVSLPSRMARSLYEWLWQHEFWLPPGITWEDMQESEDTHYPQPRDLLLSIPFALILVVIRCAFER